MSKQIEFFFRRSNVIHSKRILGVLLACCGLMALITRVDADGRHSKNADKNVEVAPILANQLLMQAGVMPDLNFYPEDLYTVPDSFWPEGFAFDREQGQLVFRAGRSVLANKGRVVAGRSSSRTTASVDPKWVEEVFVQRLTFTESSVDDNGTIVLESSSGLLKIKAHDESSLTVWVTPPDQDPNAFYPVKFLVTLQGDGSSNVAGAESFLVLIALTCKCDTTGCGGGCTQAMCEDINTCGGRCGSCALMRN